MWGAACVISHHGAFNGIDLVPLGAVPCTSNGICVGVVEVSQLVDKALEYLVQEVGKLYREKAVHTEQVVKDPLAVL